MSEHDRPFPENEPEAPEQAWANDAEEARELAEAEALGGDAEILESLPDEGSPLHGVSAYDVMAEELEEADAEPDAGDEVGSWPSDADEDDTGFDAEQASAYDDAEVPAYDFLDIDAALASVAALGDSAAEREEWEREQLATERDAGVEPEEAAHKPLRSIQAPSPVSLRRGQLASVVPALLLMGIGAWLTFAMTAPDAVPVNPFLVAAALLGALVVTLLAYWLSSGRWARGAFFFAILALLVAGFAYYGTTLAVEASVIGPLVLAATGLAFALTGLLARPMDRRLLLPGILFLVAAAVSLAAIIGYLPATLLTGIAPYWPALVAVLAIVWLLPLLAKRRS